MCACRLESPKFGDVRAGAEWRGGLGAVECPLEEPAMVVARLACLEEHADRVSHTRRKGEECEVFS